MIREIETQLAAIERELSSLGTAVVDKLRRSQLQRDRQELEAAAAGDLSPADRVYLARHPGRPNIDDYTAALFQELFEQRGDRQCADDRSIWAGIGLFHGRPVTVVGHSKGKGLEENVARNFGMPNPEGYRKALRAMEQAEKFGRPIITFVDTPGAYPGLEAEARGQGEAIARLLMRMSALTVPVIAVVIGEGGSGGALALSVANTVIMLENAVYSVLSPEGFASILWKDSSRMEEACGVMKLTARDLLELGVADRILPEPSGGAHRDPQAVFRALDGLLWSRLRQLEGLTGSQLAAARYEKFRGMGTVLCPSER